MLPKAAAVYNTINGLPSQFGEDLFDWFFSILIPGYPSGDIHKGL